MMDLSHIAANQEKISMEFIFEAFQQPNFIWSTKASSIYLLSYVILITMKS